MYGVDHMTHIWNMSWSCKTYKDAWVIAGVPSRTNVDNLYLELDILPVKKIFVYTIAISMYKYMNGMLPELFLGMFTSISDIHNYDKRQAMKKIVCFLQINF